MSFAAIDLALLPAPDVIDTIDTDAIVDELKSYLVIADPALADVLALESEPLVKMLELWAYREALLRSRVNHAAQAVMLPHATGADLDNLAALMGVVRLEVAAGDPDAIPPVAATMETDESLRRRVQLAPEGATAAGTEGTYLFYALAAHSDVADASVIAPEVGSGRVEITILAQGGDGTPDVALLDEVRTTLEPRRVTTDLLSVHAPAILPWALEAELTLFPGPDSAIVLDAARAALDVYIAATRRLGYDVTISGLHAALHQPGVQRVSLIQPAADIICGVSEAAHCTGITISGAARDV